MQDVLNEREELIHRLSGVGVRDEWMPDPAIFMFVLDCLSFWHGRRPDLFPRHPLDFPSWWMPITIVGTLDWVVITTWWIWKETGFYNTDDPMDWVYSYLQEGGGIYHFPPKDIMEFKNNPHRREEKFSYRTKNPNIDDRERRSLINWLMRDNYPSWGLEPPPQEIVEQICWATLTWLVSNKADDFYRQLDEMFVQLLNHKHLLRSVVIDDVVHTRCIFCNLDEEEVHVQDYCAGEKMAHLGRFGAEEYGTSVIELLEEIRVQKTDQPKGSCTRCGLIAWCVRLDVADYDKSQFFLCRHCYTQALQNDQIGLSISPDTEDDCFTCKNKKCRHHPRGEEGFWDELAARGDERLKEWARQVEANGGLNPRIKGGDAELTISQIVEHFTSQLLGG